ncbi:unnamed protein product [Eruca vesicaria subsp. sativa]|uniref:F-box domain-containing protein n=1 Tax=Eruca vesicaria subsp. sativa TaxID=29727 RepID=A0ABC8LHW5_ERUVS|nr:unnamed protein product [Eruca vesicaria subsp. sativa]
MESLPEDIQYDILLRLPLKTLLACSCVCRKLKTMICDEKFKTRYLEPSLLMLFMTRDMDSGPHWLFDSVCTERGQHTVSAPIRGWICVQSATKLRLYNPIANKILRLPVSLAGPDECLFGYDEANGVFKVLGFFNSSFKVYTVTSGNGEGSWRPIECEDPHMYVIPSDTNPPLSVTNALCKGGVLYYAAITIPYHRTKIMSFDLNSEEFSVNKLPEGFILDDDSTMVNYNGKVALVNDSATELQKTGGFKICVRNDDSGKWELERVVIPDWKNKFRPHVLTSFVGTLGTGELVFTAPTSWPRGGSEYVLYYKTGSLGLSGTFLLEGEDIGAYHSVRACLNHFECLFRSTT